MLRVAVALLLAPLLALAACRDISAFSTHGDSYQGPVNAAPFILAGVDGGSTAMCLTLDTSHLQDQPGTLSTSDGRFHSTALRTIPQIWQDPVSTLQFGEGRLKNLVYVARASTPFTDGNGDDVFIIISLMQAGDIEVRMLRSAPILAQDGGPGPPVENVFAVFDLTRAKGPCSY